MNKALLSSKKMNWETPPEIFKALDAEFHFEMDLAASQNNTKCALWFQESHNALAQSWEFCRTAWGFCNPPYGREIGKWVKKAYSEMCLGANVVMLIPARTDTRYWADHIWDHEKHCPREGIEVRFLKGRIRFIDPDTGKPGDPAPFPSAVVVFWGCK